MNVLCTCPTCGCEYNSKDNPLITKRLRKSTNIPLKELREIVERATLEAREGVRCQLTSVYEHGDMKRLDRWRKRLKAAQKASKWLEGLAP